MESYEGGVGISAGSLMLKWNLMDQMIKDSFYTIKEGDKVNVFINLESVLNNLTLQRNLQTLINFNKQKVVIELESAIINLMAHYRSYFRKEKCDVTMYFYFTSLEFNNQQMIVYNKFYRSYYKNRYVKNPQFRSMGEILNKIIIPEIKLILLYVPKCYFIETKSFDGSIIPEIISKFSNNKNVIISGDIFDTLYMLDPNFLVFYIKRKYSNLIVTNNIPETVQSIIRDENPWDLSIFNSEMYFRLLLSIKGSKIRNIKSAKGFGYNKFLTLLKNGMSTGLILKDFTSIDSIIEIFPKEYREDIKNAFQCTSIETQYSLLSDIDIEEIKSQIIDKTDMESLNALNNRRFLDNPIQLNSLIN